jgi:hypothetical protein
MLVYICGYEDGDFTFSPINTGKEKWVHVFTLHIVISKVKIRPFFPYPISY